MSCSEDVASLSAGVSDDATLTKRTQQSGARCAFCAVVAGEATAATVHTGERFVAFLDTKPVFHGHVLLVPRAHVTTLADLPGEDAGDFLRLAQRLERAVESAMDAPGSLVLVNNVVSQSVPHLHLHVIPRRPKDGLRFFLGPRHPYGGPDEARSTAERIHTALEATAGPV